MDLTSTDAYELSSDSSEYIKSLDKQIKIDVMTDKQSLRSAGSYFIQVDEIINQYAKLNSNITVNYIDIVKNPAYASNYPNQDVAQYDICLLYTSTSSICYPDAGKRTCRYIDKCTKNIK